MEDCDIIKLSDCGFDCEEIKKWLIDVGDKVFILRNYCESIITQKQECIEVIAIWDDYTNDDLNKKIQLCMSQYSYIIKINVLIMPILFSEIIPPKRTGLIFELKHGTFNKKEIKNNRVWEIPSYIKTNRAGWAAETLASGRKWRKGRMQ